MPRFDSEGGTYVVEAETQVIERVKKSADNTESICRVYIRAAQIVRKQEDGDYSLMLIPENGDCGDSAIAEINRRLESRQPFLNALGEGDSAIAEINRRLESRQPFLNALGEEVPITGRPERHVEEVEAIALLLSDLTRGRAAMFPAIPD